MRRSRIMGAMAYMLLGKVVAQAPRTLSPELGNAQPGPPELGLRRRQLDNDFTSGTLTITIAPDETPVAFNTDVCDDACISNRYNARCTSSTHRSSGSAPVGAIVGGVVGGLAVIALTVLGVIGILFLRRRKRNETAPSGPDPGLAPQSHNQSTMPDPMNTMASPT
ncbi:hypothetical protein B0T10DRAFT_541982 [Thelonectria olida]|uniref:Mid2 domain-containing protein n=1 Tax=Thelonectria olida TaxID=1576542 RepID=A0A9P8WHK7_9HYPO|nr:hypothetical protein B0T10DRAFT_541982 [Thelonectria olida]